MQVYKNIEVPSWLTDFILSQGHTTGGKNTFDPKKNDLDLWIGTVIGSAIDSTENWFNYVVSNDPGECTYYRWHNESGYDQDPVLGTHVATVWISGSMGCGGCYQWLDEQGMLYEMPFEPNTLFVSDTKTIHRVSQYLGTEPRISLTFCFNYKEA